MSVPELWTYASEHCAPDKPPIRLFSPAYMLHFVQSGRGFYNGKAVRAGMGFLTICGSPVEYYPDPADPWYYAWVDFLDASMLEPFARVFRPDENMLFSFDTSLGYVKEIERAYVAYGRDVDPDRRKADHDLLEVSYAGTALWYTLLSIGASDKTIERSDRRMTGSRYVEEAKKYMEIMLAVPDFNIAALAQSLHISRAYLRNLFAEQCGESVKAYYIRQKLERACHYLRTTDSPVGVIAGSVGYPDALQFSRIFHKHMHMSPTAFRLAAAARENESALCRQEPQKAPALSGGSLSDSIIPSP